MEEKSREVVTSFQFDFIDIPEIHLYGWATFGLKLADIFIDEIYASLNVLSENYYLHPECRHLVTKT